LNVYGARGVLIESKGPSWIQSASNEHSTLYNWQLNGAKNIYLGQIQSETPYFQAGQLEATLPYFPGLSEFNEDPTYDHCPRLARRDESSEIARDFDTCRESWALRILRSSDIYLYGGGFYSFFKDYKDTCAKTGGVCQDRLIDTSYSEQVWIYNLYTVGAKEIISPQGTKYKELDRTRFVNGFATSLTAWLFLAGRGKSHIGGTRKSQPSRKSSGGPSMWCSQSSLFNGTYKRCTGDREDSQPPFSTLDDTTTSIFEASGARSIWCDAMQVLRDVPRNSTYFGSHEKMSPSKVVALHFNYYLANYFTCGNLMDTGCQVAVNCPSGGRVLEAQRLILQSFVFLSKVSKCYLL
jgi:hypothetical protein